MMDPTTLINLLVGAGIFGTDTSVAVISDILGSRADDWCVRTYRHIQNRLKEGGRPVSHELEKAVLRAYLSAQRILAQDCIRLL
ncbi:MAG: hypothetical protein ACUVV1_02970 [Fimbriimonadales bacterium]